MKLQNVKVITCGNHPKVNGGITSVISQILSYDWKTHGITMDFIPTYYGGNLVKKFFGFVYAYIKLSYRFTTNKPDFVHIHMSYKGSFYRAYRIQKLCEKRGIKTIIHLHGSTFKDWYDSINDSQKEKVKLLFETASTTIVLGNKWYRVIHDIAPKANIMILNNAVHIPDKSVTWDNNCFKILFMGVLIERKGVSDLIDAIDILRNQNLLHNMKFLIAGTGNDETALRKKVIQYGIESYVEFVGWVLGKEKEKYYLDSQVFILPSYNEGLPVAILEAMSYGLPVIASDVGDVSTAVLNDENGYLIKPGDASSMAKYIYQLSTSRSKYEAMSTKSRELAETMFSDELFYEKLCSTYFA